MILKAKHNPLIYRFFKQYAVRKTNKEFEKVELCGNFENKNKPLLIIANHISWWDGFWIMYLNRKVLHKKFHFMMLEKQLKKYWFFNYCGGFSVDKSSRTIIESLNHTIDILQDTNNMVMLFPQGEINSIYQNDIVFEKGLDWILKRANNIQVVQIVNLIDYFSNPKPSLYMYFEELVLTDQSISIADAYQKYYSQCIEIQKTKNN